MLHVLVTPRTHECVLFGGITIIRLYRDISDEERYDGVVERPADNSWQWQLGDDWTERRLTAWLWSASNQDVVNRRTCRRCERDRWRAGYLMLK